MAGSATPWHGRRSLLLDVGIASGVLVISLALAGTAADSQPGTRPVDPLAWILVVICSLAVVARRRLPLAVALLEAAGLVLFAARDYPGGPLLAPMMVALYTAGTALPRRRALMFGLGATAVVAVRAWATTRGHSQISGYTWAAPGWVIASFCWGVAVRARRQTVQVLRDRAEQAEHTREEEARRRVAEERVRIARDLHDVIGHSFATINVQARAATTTLPDTATDARQSLAAIETTSRDALREIRQALSVLRAPDGGPSAPPGALDPEADLDRLAAPLRAAGVTVCTTVDPPQPALPLLLAQGIHRIVQEAVTNVLKHSTATQVTIRVNREPGAVRVEVSDDGTPRPGRNGSRPAGAGGHGIAGMRERALALGGELTVGPVPAGGFAVVARLPVER